MKIKHLQIAIPLLVGVLLLFFPLLRDFHFESAFMAAIVGAFWAGISLTKLDRYSDLKRSLQVSGYILLIGVAPFLNSIFVGCFSLQGLGFWLLLPIPSVLFGAAVGRFVRHWGFRFPALTTVLILIWISFGAWLIEFYTLPQVYFFNHVWGNWPGPIYDETLTISASLIFFRTITLLWAGVLWLIPHLNKKVSYKITISAMLFFLAVCYLNLTSFQVITPRNELKKELPQLITTKHFDLYFDSNNFSPQEADYWASKHEFYFSRIINQLEIDWPDNRKIESYLYANAWQKKKLVGAKFTSYVPIWLAKDQLHIAKQQLEGVLQHELVHVLSKQFGNALFNGSYSIGVIEGIAEAIAQDASSESTLHQIIAAEQPYPSAEKMETALSLAGFYSSASSISYTTAGSFVQFLLNTYPVEKFKNAYPNVDFETAYAKPFNELIEEWHQQLNAVKIDSVDKNISEFIFSRRSLFQKECPHKMDAQFSLWDEYGYALSIKDSSKAFATINELYSLVPANNLVKREWVSQQLQHENYSISEAFAKQDTLLTLELLKADALFLSGNLEEAHLLLKELKPKLESTSARNFKYSYELRSDSLNWHYFLASRYKNEFPDLDQFELLETSTQLLILSKSLETNTFANFLPVLNSVFNPQNLSQDWFDIYYRVIDQLIYLRKNEEATIYLKNVETISLRARYSQRLHLLFDWNSFLGE